MLKIIGGLNEIELFYFRPFNEWHGKGFTSKDPMKRCLRSDCPHEVHWDYIDIIDPKPLEEIQAIKKGSKMLVLMEYFETHVSYIAFDSIRKFEDCAQIVFSESSLNGNYFFPDGRHGFRFDIFMHFLRRVAVVESDSPSFGRYGGAACFVKKLEEISGVPRVELMHQIRKYNISRRGKI